MISDDFGQTVLLVPGCAILFEDLDQSKLAHVERSLHMARTQALANKTAAADPGLNQRGLVTPGGPQVFQPGMLNGR